MARLSFYYSLVLLFIVVINVDAQKDCNAAPTESLRYICNQLYRWDSSIRWAAELMKAGPQLPPEFGGSLIKPDVIPRVLQECVTIACACSYLGGAMSGDSCRFSKGVFGKVVRKEYRVMSDDERARYHAVLNSIRDHPEHVRLRQIHAQTGTSGSAHSGPGFLGWHREFIKRYEFLIRREDPTLYLPYWDSTLDGALPTPADSIMFTEAFMGYTDAQGNLIVGPFKNWRTLEGRANILRAVGARGSGFLESDINRLMAFTKVEDVLASTAPQTGCPRTADWYALEYTHGQVHLFMGGDMVEQSTSANDPIFFLHHSFVDLLWEQWRQTHQNRDARETEYPVDNQLCTGPQHFRTGIMRPFSPMQNIDGLSNAYTDNIYEYAPRPRCPDCSGSKYLFCDYSHGSPRCAAKVRPNGNCTGFTQGEPVCYSGVCVGGRCVAQEATTQPPPTPSTTQQSVIVTAPPTAAPTTTQQPTTTLRPATTAAPAVTETCFNEIQCCSAWARAGYCTTYKNYMDQWCTASCGFCQPRAYKLEDDCSDRHINCAQWASLGECRNNPNWMTENCRRSCQLCSTSRASVCANGSSTTTSTTAPTTTTRAAPPPPPTTPRPPSQPVTSQCISTGCFNEYQCCQIWAREGQCRTNATWMSCNCKVSCNICTPTAFRYGSCEDYHTACAAWAWQGECQRNRWMLENCRTSCRNCPSQWQLENRCGVRRGSFSNFGGFGDQWSGGGNNNWNNQWNNNNNWGNRGWNNGWSSDGEWNR